jgi:branched-chain amino acid transport system permease protein
MAVKYLRRIYTSFATHVYDVPPRMMAFLILVILSVVPLTGLDLDKLSMLYWANVFAILAVSWDLLVGRTGQISLGHALFYGAGAYGSALLFKYFGWPIWITIPLSLLMGVGIAVVVGFPCLRVKGPYLALVTMSLPLAVNGFLYYFRDVFGADIGLRLPSVVPLSINLFGQDIVLGFSGRYTVWYYVSLSLMAISASIIYKIANSKTGVVFVSILDDELASKACGINVTKYKLMAFAISGLFGSLAGCIGAYLQRGATPSMLDVSVSITPLVATILGGIGTIYGPLVGTYIYFLLDRYVFIELVPLGGTISTLIFMLIVVVFVIKWPRGIGRVIVEKLEDLEEPREIEEVEKKKAKTG